MRVAGIIGNTLRRGLESNRAARGIHTALGDVSTPLNQHTIMEEEVVGRTVLLHDYYDVLKFPFANTSSGAAGIKGQKKSGR